MFTQSELSKKLKKEAINQGFNLVGIARVPGSERVELRNAALERWLEAGKEGDMKWMHAKRRKNVNELLKGTKSILAVGINYYTNESQNEKNFLIARYAWGNDYHKTIKKRLKAIGSLLQSYRPDCQWRVCVDSSPMLEKAWAEEAGIGWIGKNSNLINQDIGSWFLIGHLLCTEALTPDKPAQSICGECEKCISACPTQAIEEPFVINAKKCLAYHTIESKEPELPISIQNSIGNWVAGCDICQDICPWNQKKLISSKDPDMQIQQWILNFNAKEALSWNDTKWKEKLQSSALKRIKPWMWRRNIIAITKKNNHEK